MCNLCNHLHASSPLWNQRFPMLSLPLSDPPGSRTPSSGCRRIPLLPLDPDLLLCQPQLDEDQGSGWLGELQTHGWDSILATIRFRGPGPRVTSAGGAEEHTSTLAAGTS